MRQLPMKATVPHI